MRYRLRRRWGQHFLTDTNLLQKIVRIIDPQPDDSILEIGPGEGALTELLAPRVKEITGIEIDRGFYHTLISNDVLAGCRFINGDFLKVDLSSLVFSNPSPRVAGNIPYRITSPIIFRLLETPGRWKDIHLMVQKEVADRLRASVGSKVYGRLTVMVQALVDVNQELSVPPEVFVPRPSVRSALVSLKYHGRYQLDGETLVVLRAMIREAFSQRRKMVKNSLGNYPLKQISGFDFSRRPEMITVTEFMDLAKRFCRIFRETAQS